MTVQVDQKRAEGAATLERKVINTKLGNVSNRLGWQGHNAPENGVARGLDSEPIGDTNSQPAAGREPNDLHNVKQALRDPCKGIYKGRQALHKDFSGTVGRITKAFTDLYQQPNLPPTTRQVGELAQVATMYPCGWIAAERAAWASLCGKSRDCKHIFTHFDICDC